VSYTKRPENAGAVVMNFVGADRERFDERDGNILVVYGQQLAELFGYLEITADDYEAASKVYGDSLERFHALVNATHERLGNDRPMTAEEQELSDELASTASRSTCASRRSTSSRRSSSTSSLDWSCTTSATATASS
jgi:hypothetical protein